MESKNKQNINKANQLGRLNAPLIRRSDLSRRLFAASGRIKERMETLEEKVARVLKEEVAVVPYDARQLEMFEQERLNLLICLLADVVKRIEHFGRDNQS